MLSRGYLSFHKTVSFLQEQRVKVCAFTKTYRLSRFVRYHENQTDLSPELPEHLQYQKVYSEKLMFSIWCLNIADMCTAEVCCLCQFCLCKSTKFAIISNGQTEKPKLIDAFIVHIPVPFSIQTDVSPVFFLAYSRIYRKETM